MKNHYTYRITNIIKNKHYYGVRTSKLKPKEDLGIYYFSSSHDKDFIKSQKENPKDYKYKVIREFNNRKDAIEFEIRLHNKFNVGVNENFYNKSKQTSTGWDTTGNKEVSLKMVTTRKNNNSYKTGGLKQSALKQSEEWKENVGKISSLKMLKTREKNGTTNKGKNNHKAKKINIFNSEGILMYECHGTFKQVCRENNLPLIPLQKTHINNTKISSSKFTNGETKKRIEAHMGWYSRVI